MIKRTKYWIVISLILMLIFCISSVVAEEGGSGSFSSEDDNGDGKGSFTSKDEESVPDDDDDDDDDDDEGYGTGKSKSDDKNYKSVSVGKYPTSNPVFLLLFALIFGSAVAVKFK